MTGRGTYQENKFDEDAERVTEYYRDNGYVKAALGQPELKFLEDSGDKKTRWVELRIPVTEGQRYRVGDFNFAGNTVVKTEALRPLFKIAMRATTTARSGSGRDSRSRRSCTAPAATSSSPAIPDMKFRDEPESGRAADAGGARRRSRTGRGPGHRRRHDADPGRQAVLRQPHHVRRQHDHARQRDPPRDAPVRERRLQHRGAEIQHPPAQSARLLQAARGPGQGRDVREDAQCRGQGRRAAEARRAEPQPADLRRRRLAVRGLLRSAVVPDGQLPRPRREPDPVAAGRLARAELHAGVHRAVPVRSEHHRRRQPVPQRRPLHRPVHPDARPARC